MGWTHRGGMGVSVSNEAYQRAEFAQGSKRLAEHLCTLQDCLCLPMLGGDDYVRT